MATGPVLTPRPAAVMRPKDREDYHRGSGPNRVRKLKAVAKAFSTMHGGGFPDAYNTGVLTFANTFDVNDPYLVNSAGGKSDSQQKEIFRSQQTEQRETTNFTADEMQAYTSGPDASGEEPKSQENPSPHRVRFRSDEREDGFSSRKGALGLEYNNLYDKYFGKASGLSPAHQESHDGMSHYEDGIG